MPAMKLRVPNRPRHKSVISGLQSGAPRSDHFAIGVVVDVQLGDDLLARPVAQDHEFELFAVVLVSCSVFFGDDRARCGLR